MTNSKQNPVLGWNVLFVVSLIGILASGVFMWASSRQAPKVSSPAELAGINRLTDEADQQSLSAYESINAASWNLDVESLGPKTLDVLTELTEKHEIKLASFRTQTPLQVANLREVPFVAVVEGPYSKVMELVQTIEDPKSRLAMSLLQISSADASTDRVTATIGLVGFLQSEVK